MDKMTRKLLNLAVDPRATTAQLEAGIDYIMQSIEAENARRAANPPSPQPVPSDEERMADLRRRANANLARKRR
jgi:hypothetical protein